MNVQNAVLHVEIHVVDWQNPFNVLVVALIVVLDVLAFPRDLVPATMLL